MSTNRPKKRDSSSKPRFSSVRLVAQCRDGESHAATELFNRYLDRLTALARARISPQLAARFDASDVVMSAYRSFFVGLRDRAFEIDDSRDLWQLLVQITLRKLYRQANRHTANKRSARRDVSASDNATAIPIPSRDASPDEAAALADELEFLLGKLPPVGRRVVELRLQGEEIESIAAAIQVNERTVRRWLNRARQLLAARQDAPRLNKVITPARAVTKRAHPRVGDFAFTINYDDYVLQKMIGDGASGKVYRALCRRDGRLYALKFLRKAFSSDAGAIERFLSEFALVAKLKHPHIMPVAGCGRTSAGVYFFAMELATGDLRQTPGRQVSVGQAVRWITQAANGVAYAHGQGVVHCDLKPSNLLLSEKKEVLVTDFGLACSEDTLAHRRKMAGTPAFMAPEQVSPAWGQISPRTDVYGLGATLYTMLTGRPPFVGQRISEILAQVISGLPPLSPTELRRKLPEAVGDVCLRCMAKNPADRFPSVEALISALGDLKGRNS